MTFTSGVDWPEIKQDGVLSAGFPVKLSVDFVVVIVFAGIGRAWVMSKKRSVPA